LLNYHDLSEPLPERCLETNTGKTVVNLDQQSYIRTWKGINLCHNYNY